MAVGDSASVEANETIPGNAVSVFGNITLRGTVNGNAVSVFGSSRIDGTVHGNAVVVFGTLKLGPNAHIDGNAVAAVGIVNKEPGAYVGGNTVQQGATRINFSDDSEASNWWNHGLRMGRPLALGHHLTFFWIFNACMVALYVVLVLLFPEGSRKCADTLVKRPGITFLTGVLAMIALPVVFVLLCIHGRGHPRCPGGPAARRARAASDRLRAGTSIYALVGRSILGKEQHAALAVLAGALVVYGGHVPCPGDRHRALDASSGSSVLRSP